MGSLAVILGLQASLLAPSVSRKRPLFTGPGAAVCRPLQIRVGQSAPATRQSIPALETVNSQNVFRNGGDDSLREPPRLRALNARTPGVSTLLASPSMRSFNGRPAAGR
jgi:hypothetical protein